MVAPASPPRVRCRQIGDGDIAALLKLLSKSGFGGSCRFWRRGFDRLAQHPTPPGFPKYGYMLESAGVPVGMILTIASALGGEGAPEIRCNVSSWYVEPDFRCYAPLLASRALNRRDATYFNISPRPHTLPILQAQGYTRYCSGRFVAIPTMRTVSAGAEATVEPFEPGLADESLAADEIDLLQAHAGYGCLSLICRAGSGRFPFVFEPRRKFGFLPFAYLVYCRDRDDFVRFSAPLQRYLLRRGFPLVVLDANGAIPGLSGWYGETCPKYFKGPEPPRLGDLAYSEQILLGIPFGTAVAARTNRAPDPTTVGFARGRPHGAHRA
jgi:hypothetical protein